MTNSPLERAPDQIKAQFSALMSNADGLSHSDFLSTPLALDDRERIRAIRERPSRLDAAAVDSLSHALVGQRRLEDVLGPEVVLPSAVLQLESITHILRQTEGENHKALAHLVAEWTTFVGWLYTATNRHDRARILFEDAVDLADRLGDGAIASTATSFQGHLARLQGRAPAVVRASVASLATPGIHDTQRVFDMLQAAQGYADMGQKDDARRFLDQAADLAGDAGDPPASVYWYTEPFFRLNIGLAQAAIGEYREASLSLKSGLEDIPADQKNAGWLLDYRQALELAEGRA